MELNKTEMQSVEQAIEKAAEKDLSELQESQLAVVAGGIGDVVWG